MRKSLFGAALLAIPILASGPASACYLGYSDDGTVSGFYSDSDPTVSGFYAEAPEYGYSSVPGYYAYSYVPRHRVYGFYDTPGLAFSIGREHRRHHRLRW
jgi:hypothetical protein